ncbi:MAG: acyl-CoA synthetase [Ardenticatenaceae bacterium]
MVIGDWLARRAMLTPNKVALVDTLDEGRQVTYREWNRAANRTANFLRERLGVRKGYRVAVLAKNSVAYLDIWFALGKLGAILQNLNWRLTASELGGLVADATPTVLIYGPEFVEQVQALREEARSVQAWVALDGELRAAPNDIPFTERDHLGGASPPEAELSMDDPWVICYTGGTTGLPKGAVLTHGSIFWNSVNTVMSWGLTADDMTILNAPLFHTGGLNVFTAPLVHVGGTSIVCREFDVNQLFDLIRDYDVSLYFGVPTMFIAMQQHPRWEEVNFSRLRLFLSGGAPCPMPVFERFWARGVDFKTGYGLTEAGPNNFWLPPEETRRKPGAVGFPLFHVDAKVVDEAGIECGPNEMGELIIRGPHVCAGYWNCPDATSEAIRDGWLYTGDLARRDTEGCYTIVGRLKDMIISGGENIYPAEVESALAAHPAVAEVALIGVPHDKWGEVGCAIVVPCRDTVTEDELLSFARVRLARYKVPKRVIFTNSLPKTGAGKVDKKLLQEQYGE